MGADLIGIMAALPRERLDHEIIDAAALRIQKRRAELITPEVLAKHFDGAEDVLAEILANVASRLADPDNKLDKPAAVCTELVDALGWGETSEDPDLHFLSSLYKVTDEGIRAKVAEFADWVDQPDGRDLAMGFHPDLPDKAIVFAGEMTWGDEPEGTAYETLRDLATLGLDEDFGVVYL